MPPRRALSNGSSRREDVKGSSVSSGESLYKSVANGKAAASERARERKLRDDPLVTVQSPQLVVCNRCGAAIKLSLKSAYDPFHWQRHRERCLKRPEAVVRELRDANGKTPTPDSDWSVNFKKQMVCHAPSGTSTPPLVSDTEEEGDRASSSNDSEDTPSPVTRPRALPSFPLFDPERSALYATCELGSQAFERWHIFSQRALTYDSSADSSGADCLSWSPDADEHFDPLYWPPRITFQESQLRSTS